MSNVSTEVQIQAMVKQGLTRAQAEKAVAGLANLREKAPFEVVAPDDPKYGDATLLKRYPNTGNVKRRFNLWADDIPAAIQGLQERYAAVRPEVEFTPFALTTEEEDAS